MEKIKILSLAVFLSVCSVGLGDDNYWHRIKKHLNPKTSEQVEKAEQYFESLTQEQLLIAAKQYCAVVDKKIPPERWGEAMMDFGFFFVYYPRKSKGLENIQNLTDEMKDKSQSGFWRCALMQLFASEWLSKLNSEQTLYAANAMKVIFADVNDLMPLRQKAVKESLVLYISASRKNVLNDPAVKKVLSSNKRVKEVLEDAQAGRIHLSKNTVKMSDKISNALNKCVIEQSEFFTSKNTTPEFKKSIVSAWAISIRCGFKKSELIKKRLKNFLQNFKEHEEKIWYPLARANLVYLENDENKLILQNMIEVAKDEKIKKQLTRLQKKINKK